jgi:hypothetical protein
MCLSVTPCLLFAALCCLQVEGTAPAPTVVPRGIHDYGVHDFLLYPCPGRKYWGAEKGLALLEGFSAKHVVLHKDLYALKPVKRIYSFTKLCTAMKHYDCALLRMEQAFEAMCRPVADCPHTNTLQYPLEDHVLLSFSEPQSLLINMPGFQFCAQCGQCLGRFTRDNDQDQGLNHNIGYSERVM